MARTAVAPCIYVLAGTNGAGKSSIGGAAFRAAGTSYFNPDEAAAKILERTPGMSQTEANSAAWLHGKRLLERAISERLEFAFETTLGGGTIIRLLELALAQDFEVRVWYVGLASPEQHIARVRARVAAGGHDIPEDKIRERFVNSRLNLIRLLKKATEVRVYDNSVEGDPGAGKRPALRLILWTARGRVVETCQLDQVPEWAKPILAEALRSTR